MLNDVNEGGWENHIRCRGIGRGFDASCKFLYLFFHVRDNLLVLHAEELLIAYGVFNHTFIFVWTNHTLKYLTEQYDSQTFIFPPLKFAYPIQLRGNLVMH